MARHDRTDPHAHTRQHRQQTIRRRADGVEERTFFMTVIWETGAMLAVPCTVDEARRYGDAHALLPRDLPGWGEEALDALVEELGAESSAAEWERALILLGHHKSPHAHDLLSALGLRVPSDLHAFWEFAWAESCGWLGFDYIREAEQEVPLVRPAAPMLGSRSGFPQA